MKEKYLKKRSELMDKAQELIDAGKLDEAEAVMTDVKNLDEEFENASKVQANLEALKDSRLIDSISNHNVDVIGTPIAEANFSADNKTEDESKLYLTAFAKKMLGLDMLQNESECFNLMNATQTRASHGYVIPETVAAGIWTEIAENHPVLNDIVKTFVPGDLKIITGNLDSNGSWYDESTSVTDGSFTDAAIELKGYELAKSVTTSWKLRKMSISEFIPWLTREIAVRLGNALATAVFSGSGTNQPSGVITKLKAETGKPQVTTYTKGGVITYENLTTAVGLIKSGYLSGASIYAKNTDIWGMLANILDANDRPIFIPDVTAGGVGRIFGIPVKEEDGITAGTVVIGNFSQGYVMNVQEDVTIYNEEHVKSRTTDYMGYAILDGTTKTTKAFAVLEESAT